MIQEKKTYFSFAYTLQDSKKTNTNIVNWAATPFPHPSWNLRQATCSGEGEVFLFNLSILSAQEAHVNRQV